jgi:hypothetical protein
VPLCAPNSNIFHVFNTIIYSSITMFCRSWQPASRIYHQRRFTLETTLVNPGCQTHLSPDCSLNTQHLPHASYRSSTAYTVYAFNTHSQATTTFLLRVLSIRLEACSCNPRLNYVQQSHLGVADAISFVIQLTAGLSMHTAKQESKLGRKQYIGANIGGEKRKLAAYMISGGQTG